jgi:hypothetical protein
MYRLIVSLEFFWRICTTYVLYRAMSITSFWCLNTIPSRASWTLVAFGIPVYAGVHRRRPLRRGIDPSNPCPDASDVILNGDRFVFYLIWRHSGSDPVRLMLELKTPAATLTKIPERIGPWPTLIIIIPLLSRTNL